MYPPWQGGKNLGHLTFDVTTKNAKAREHFITGMKLVHTYEFPEATWSFREAQKLDPTFAMAYWGEIMASHMFVWYAKEPEQARDAYNRMMNNINLSSLSGIEQGLIAAARILVEGNGVGLMPYEKGSRLQQFRDVLGVLQGQYPDSLELKVLYGYAILGSRRGVRDFETNSRARRYFNMVLKENPQHPGALHYLIHASENTVQGDWARKAADSFGDIASASIHALHMPSHYYYTKGNWPKVIEINQNAWEASKQRVKDTGLSQDNLEFHGFGWITYGMLQQGRHGDAYKVLKSLQRLYTERPTGTKLKYLQFARAGFLVDCPVNTAEFLKVRANDFPGTDGDMGARAANIFANVYSSWRSGEYQDMAGPAEEYRNLLTEDPSSMGPPSRDAVKIMGRLVDALMALADKDQNAAEEHLVAASQMEDSMVHEHGIPLVVKPANEMYGDFLLMQGRADDAVIYYRRSLEYQPGRLTSMEGLKEAGDTDL
ncbi:hypothetical protein [Parendozoicomonas sp. Alg238-R29]|uniref:hypothetical protein n=1 Tax=Parendozoicomonas sp. Alg238-R29 TaxID=2993446 RepID=UPI00248E51ED|nr:hypothetical protein [Parendozoicomonas sp. Alg238-R29]